LLSRSARACGEVRSSALPASISAAAGAVFPLLAQVIVEVSGAADETGDGA